MTRKESIAFSRKVTSLYKRGISTVRIAKLLGKPRHYSNHITRVLKRSLGEDFVVYQKKVKDNYKKRMRAQYESPKRSPDKAKRRAHSRVYYAISTGKLFRPSNCQSCGSDASKPEAHHTDYSKPLAVTWLCPACHYRADIKQGLLRFHSGKNVKDQCWQPTYRTGSLLGVRCKLVHSFECNSGRETPVSISHTGEGRWPG